MSGNRMSMNANVEHVLNGRRTSKHIHFVKIDCFAGNTCSVFIKCFKTQLVRSRRRFDVLYFNVLIVRWNAQDVSQREEKSVRLSSLNVVQFSISNEWATAIIRFGSWSTRRDESNEIINLFIFHFFVSHIYSHFSNYNVSVHTHRHSWLHLVDKMNRLIGCIRPWLQPIYVQLHTIAEAHNDCRGKHQLDTPCISTRARGFACFANIVLIPQHKHTRPFVSKTAYYNTIRFALCTHQKRETKRDERKKTRRNDILIGVSASALPFLFSLSCSRVSHKRAPFLLIKS